MFGKVHTVQVYQPSLTLVLWTELLWSIANIGFWSFPHYMLHIDENIFIFDQYRLEE